MDEKVYKSLCDIVNYLYNDEHKHWQEQDRPKQHIFRDVKRLANWIDEVAKEYTDICNKCGEIHDVEKANGHDLLQAERVAICECKEHPDDEYCKQVLKNK